MPIAVVVKLSFSINGFGLTVECLALGRLSIDRAEAFDAQLLPGFDHCFVPAGDVLVGLLASSILLLGDDLVALVDHEIRLAVSGRSLLLIALEDHHFGQLATSN
eukprot:CAMPEP_0114669436 /NCGR_PEP_ID=MMETSP0191-20121206/38072_1 /TAXON_ID=126664 /ORGANISM="Sorites sp." /LENGTH=104 /DNA_ID=CAMNT_0001925109 /DNA_START=151 /DNA_END=462 /DNA_ORIENTATION=+